MSSFSQDHRLLTFKSIYKPGILFPERMSGVEGISELFRFQVDLLSPKDAIQPEAFDAVTSSATIGIRADDSGTQRFINGMIASLELCGGDEEFNVFRAVIVPSLWALTLNTNTRVFEDQSVIDVIKFVLEPYKLTLKDDTTGPWPILEYCTQYRETDFQFISRLMEQHGILYYFKHTDNSHTFTLQDDSSKLTDCAIQDEFRYAPQTGQDEGFFDFVIDTFTARSTLVTGKFTLWDHTFFTNSRMPSQLTSAFTEGPLGENENESYDFADSATSNFKFPEDDKDAGKKLTLLQFARRNASDASGEVAEGTSNAISMATGFTFSLTKHPQLKANGKYLLTRVEHTVQQLPSFRSRTAPSPKPYSNRFTATSPLRYGPPVVTPRPRVQGLHTGIVAALQGEESSADEFGRVCVHFWWDREGSVNFVDHTMLRVAQSWAGKGWGTYFWPRAGDEVLIDFIEGDPDQPIVVGSVYNGVNMPKYDPTGQYTLSGILSRSSKGGSAANANELRFEDLKGKEQIFMKAERDYDLHVEDSWHTLVGSERHTKVGGDQLAEVGGNDFITVNGHEAKKIGKEQHFDVVSDQFGLIRGNQHHHVFKDQRELVGGDTHRTANGNLNERVGLKHSLSVGGDQSTAVGQVYEMDAGTEVHIRGGTNIVIEAGATVCLSGPGGFISIGPEGVVIQGTLVMINSGGAPIPANSVTTRDPKQPIGPQSPSEPSFPGDDPPSKRKS